MARDFAILLLVVLLASLGAAAAGEPPMVLEPGRPAKPVYWRFEATPLEEVLKVLGHEVGWHLDPGPFGKERVTVSLNGVTAAEALRQVLAPRYLTLQFKEDYWDVSPSASVVPGDAPWRPPTGIQTSFRVTEKVGDYERIATFSSDGTRARWTYLFLSQRYAWCGNSYDGYRIGSLPLADYKALHAQAHRLTWASDVSPGLAVAPYDGVLTLTLSDEEWVRGGAGENPHLDALARKAFRALPLDPAWSPTRRASPPPVRNPDLHEAYETPFQGERTLSLEPLRGALRDTLEHVREVCGGHYFLSPTAKMARIVAPEGSHRAGDLVARLAASAGCEIQFVDDLILFGTPEELAGFPAHLREWRSVQTPVDVRWTKVDLPPDTPRQVLDFLKSLSGSDVLFEADPGGGWRVLANRAETRRFQVYVRAALDGAAHPPEPTDWELPVRYLTLGQALEVVRSVVAPVRLGPAGRLQFRGTSSEFLAASQALHDADRLDRVDRVEGLKGYALRRAPTPSRGHYVFVESLGGKPLLVHSRRPPANLNHPTVLTGRITRDPRGDLVVEEE